MQQIVSRGKVEVDNGLAARTNATLNKVHDRVRAEEHHPKAVRPRRRRKGSQPGLQRCLDKYEASEDLIAGLKMKVKGNYEYVPVQQVPEDQIKYGSE